MEKMTVQERNEHLEKSGLFNSILNGIIASNNNNDIKELLLELVNRACSVEAKRMSSNLMVDIYNRLNELHDQDLSNEARSAKYDEIEYIQNKIKEEKLAANENI